MINQRMQPFRHKNKLLYFKGGSSGDSVDYAYNARMATIAEQQSDWATTYNQFWVDYEQPFEKAMLADNMKMLPGETAFTMAETEAKSELLPLQTDLSKEEMTTAMGLMPYQAEAAKESLISSAEKDRAKRPVTEKYFKEAGEGIDPEDWANNAQADAAQAFLSSSSGVEMAMARRGAAPGSGAYTGKNNESAMSRTMMTGAARTAGRESGEGENFQRLQGAMGV